MLNNDLLLISFTACRVTSFRMTLCISPSNQLNYLIKSNYFLWASIYLKTSIYIVNIQFLKSSSYSTYFVIRTMTIPWKIDRLILSNLIELLRWSRYHASTETLCHLLAPHHESRDIIWFILTISVSRQTWSFSYILCSKSSHNILGSIRYQSSTPLRQAGIISWLKQPSSVEILPKITDFRYVSRFFLSNRVQFTQKNSFWFHFECFY